MQFQRNGITVSVADQQIERIVMTHLALEPQITLFAVPPRIGAEWIGQGGIYAGIARGRDGEPDYHVIVGPEHSDDIAWQPAMDWAATIDVAGFRDFTLPWRREQSLMFANVPELFQQRAYWSREQHESYSSYAWYQNFYNGYQYNWTKLGKLRARAVRRLVIR